ncbi:putative F-box protein PP2-B12 [Rutidosis leptorrhynchoides]|uniref:putative F-box protein PP2-B12 n=1 Tax=Rutidosis leptorrhynchoides TaxID=125765 RepID=UPI003A9956D9
MYKNSFSIQNKEPEEMKENETASITVLPEGYISETLSITSPRDACRAAAISKGFNSAADSDIIWERFLPPDYNVIIARAVSPLIFGSKKQLYFMLSDSHILLDSGYLSFRLDKESGKKTYMLGARELSIAWQDDTRYWEWGHVPEFGPQTRFQEVCILKKVCWLEIRGKIKAAMLSPKSTYVAYLVFQLTRNSRGLSLPALTMVSIGGITNETENVYLQKPSRRSRLWRIRLDGDYSFPYRRKDGWMEMELGEFYNDEGDEGEVEMAYEEIRFGNWKNGLILEGIELRPK